MGRLCNIPIPVRSRARTVGYSSSRLRYTRPTGYIFNRDVSALAEVESDFDAFLEADGVSEFEPRAVIPFPNFVHREMYDGAVARIGNAAAFMEPLEATAIVSAQLQIGMVLQMRLNRSVEHLERDAPTVNRFLVGNMLRYGLFVGWALFLRVPVRKRILASRHVTTPGRNTARRRTPRWWVATRSASSTT